AHSLRSFASLNSVTQSRTTRSLNPTPTSLGTTGAPQARAGVRGAQPLDFYWSRRRGSNPRPTACEAGTIPLSYSRKSSLHQAVDGEGRTRTFEGARPTDLQSAAFDRFATSPMRCSG